MVSIEKNIFSLPVVTSHTGHFGAVKPGGSPFGKVRRTIRKAKEKPVGAMDVDRICHSGIFSAAKPQPVMSVYGADRVAAF
jgi:hypothetical protein